MNATRYPLSVRLDGLPRSGGGLKRSPMKIRRATSPDLDAVPTLGTDPVYVMVDARSDGRCEVNLGARCPKAAQDHHHTVKPRRSHHTPDLVIAICRGHHERCDWPYKRGRLVIRGLGGGVFECAILTASDKFDLRRSEPESAPRKDGSCE